MSVEELKEKLHQQIEALEDANALQLLHDAASEFAKNKKQDILDVLTKEQSNKLNTSIQQANQGKTIPHSEAMQQLAQWRNK